MIGTNSFHHSFTELRAVHRCQSPASSRTVSGGRQWAGAGQGYMLPEQLHCPRGAAGARPVQRATASPTPAAPRGLARCMGPWHCTSTQWCSPPSMWPRVPGWEPEACPRCQAGNLRLIEAHQWRLHSWPEGVGPGCCTACVDSSLSPPWGQWTWPPCSLCGRQPELSLWTAVHTCFLQHPGTATTNGSVSTWADWWVDG